MKKFFCFICLAYLSFPVKAQEALSLDSCRALAISNNKELLISQEKNQRCTLSKKGGIHQLPSQHFGHRWIYAQPKRVVYPQ